MAYRQRCGRYNDRGDHQDNEGVLHSTCQIEQPRQLQNIKCQNNAGGSRAQPVIGREAKCEIKIEPCGTSNQGKANANSKIELQIERDKHNRGGLPGNRQPAQTHQGGKTRFSRKI